MTQAVPTQVWRESHDEPAHGGEGITYTEDPSAGFYWVEVRIRGQAPMHSCVRATSGTQAVEFCHARHPAAIMARLMDGQ